MTTPPSEDRVELLSAEQINLQLTRLEGLLRALPNSIPLGDQRYNFNGFTPSDEDVSDMGMTGAINRALEVTFCPNGRSHEPIIFHERGEGLTAVVSVLRNYKPTYNQVP